MSFIGKESLSKLLRSFDIVKPFYEANIKNGSYELCLGEQVFQTDTQPRAIKSLTDGQEIYIAPGQFALLLTEETVKIPTDKIAFISIKASIKFKGLVNVSGFHVDPGFHGKLLFSVYNAGPSVITLRRGEKCFPLWFAELSEKQEYLGNHANQQSIPLDPVAALSQGDIASPNSLLEKININEKEQKSKIESLEKDQKIIDYIVKTGLGLMIVILLKVIFDWGFFNYGLTKGAEIKRREISADSTINQIIKEKKDLLIEIDSLQKIKASLITKNT